MSEKKLAKIFYADVWGLREEKYKYLFENDVLTTQWQELEPFAPYWFFVPKDFALQAEYEKFWKVTDIFKEWSSGVKTHRDHFVVGFSKEELIQRLRIFTGKLPDELVAQSLDLKDTGSWKLSEARQKIKEQKPKDKIYTYAYRPFDTRWICYESLLIDRDRWPFMGYLQKENISLVTTRILSGPPFFHTFISNFLSDICLISIKTKETSYFFPLYLYPDESVGTIHELPLRNKSQPIRISNFTPEFLRTFSVQIGTPVGAEVAPTPEEIFYYIYAVLYSPTYRKRYEEFLKIDFPRVPLPSSHDVFRELSNLGKELVDLHLLKHTELEKTEVGFPISGSNKVEKVSHAEEDQRVFINKEQYFDGISNELWEYRIGAYQVMEKYLKDRKGRKLSLDEINHYMKVAKAIQLTIELQEKIDSVYKKKCFG
jgi:predicted helicase